MSITVEKRLKFGMDKCWWLLVAAMIPLILLLQTNLFFVVLIGLGAFGAVFILYYTIPFIIHRQEAFPDANEMFESGVRNGRIKLGKSIEVYLPPLPMAVNDDGITAETNGPKSMGTRKSDTSFHALYFLPGALVSSKAYAVAMSKLSDRGLLVVVDQYEPFRMPVDWLGATPQRAERIRQEVQDMFPCCKLNWAIGGHSMGGHAATEIVRSPSLDWNKLVFWGGGSLMSSESQAHLKQLNCLVLQPTLDGSLNRLKDLNAKNTEIREIARLVEIKGGNHAGFAHYGPQEYPFRDGERSIPLDKQIDLAVEETAKFILGDRYR